MYFCRLYVPYFFLNWTIGSGGDRGIFIDSDLSRLNKNENMYNNYTKNNNIN